MAGIPGGEWDGSFKSPAGRPLLSLGFPPGPVPALSSLTFTAGLLEGHGQVAAGEGHAVAVVAQGRPLRLPGGARGDVGAGGAAVDAGLAGGGVSAGRQEGAHGGEPRAGLGTATGTEGDRGSEQPARRGASRSGADGAPRPLFPSPRPLPDLPALSSSASFQPHSCHASLSPSVPSPHLGVFDVAVHGSLVQPVDRLARPGKAASVPAGPLFHFGRVRGPLGASQSPWGTKRQPRTPRAGPEQILG